MLSRKEIADLLGVSKRTVDRLIKQGSFPIYRIGKTIRARKADVLKFLESKKEEIG